MGRRHIQPSFGRLAVGKIIIPLPAHGFVAVHEHAVLLTHIAIKILHAQLLTTARPSSKSVGSAEETIVGANIDDDAELRRPAAHILQHAVFAWVRNYYTVASSLTQATRNLTAQGASVARVVELGVSHLVAALLQLGGKVAHSREQQGDLLFVVLDVSRLFPNLAQQHHIVGDIAIAQAGDGLG